MRLTSRNDCEHDFLGEIVNLDDCLAIYVARTQLASRTIGKLRHGLAAWLRWTGSLAVPTVAVIESARATALSLGLSPTTIEAVIADLVTICAAAGFVLDRGRPLKRRSRCRPVPELDAVARLYAVADQCRYPSRLATETGFEVVAPEMSAHWLRAVIVLGLWTGLRLQDLLHLRWDSVTDERIVWQASKTSKEHRFPMCSVVRSHLEPLKQFNRPTVLACNATNTTAQRNELHRLCEIAGVQPITAQALRRASVTTWATVSPEAGRIIHGTGLGVLRHYYDGERILRACANRFPWPTEMLPPDQRDTRQRSEAELLAVIRRLDPSRLADLTKVAVAFSG